MNKIKYAPLAIFALFSLKLLITGANLEAAITLAVLGAVSAWYEFKSNDQKVTELSNKINSLTIKVEDKEKDLEAIKTTLASMRIAQGYKKIG